MTLDEVCAGPVAVWGTGTEGLAMARLLLDRGVSPVLVDDRPEESADRVAAGLGPGHPVVLPGDADWRSVATVVRSPGVTRSRPELRAAEAAGAQVTTAMAVWLEDARDATVVAVTGTKGKSTTAALTAAVLEAEGASVSLVGNIGAPVTDRYGAPPVDVTVVEVSSYQAADVTVTPRVCVLTSLAPDHLDWHGGEEAYYRDKLRLITAGPPGALAVNAASPEAVLRTEDRPDRLLYGAEGRVTVDQAGVVSGDGVPLVTVDRLRVPGAHNVANLCGAVTGALLALGRMPSPGAVAAAVDGFAGLPSRCAPVGEVDGLLFVDDALASNPFATAASVAAFPGRELTVIVGGDDRGTDPGVVLAALSGRRPPARAVVLGSSRDRLSAVLRATAPPVPASPAEDLADAVRVARSVTPSGGVVLFSPSAPTPSAEGTYRDRSRAFVAAVGSTDGGE